MEDHETEKLYKSICNNLNDHGFICGNVLEKWGPAPRPGESTGFYPAVALFCPKCKKRVVIRMGGEVCKP